MISSTSECVVLTSTVVWGNNQFSPATNGYDFAFLEQKQSLVLIETYMLYGVNLEFKQIIAIVNIMVM